MGISVTGSDVDEIVHALATGKRERPGVQAAPGFDLVFYKGTSHLATIKSTGALFFIGNTTYSFTTNTMDELLLRLRIENDLRAR